MIRHITLINFKEDTTQEQKDLALNAFVQRHLWGAFARARVQLWGRL